MKTDAKARRREILDSATHYITAFVVLLKGIDKVETPGKQSYGIFFICTALFIFLATVFHHRFEKQLRHLKAYVYILEAIVVGLVGYLYMKEGRQLQYAYFFASIMFVVALVVYVVKLRRNKIVRV